MPRFIKICMGIGFLCYAVGMLVQVASFLSSPTHSASHTSPEYRARHPFSWDNTWQRADMLSDIDIQQAIVQNGHSLSDGSDCHNPNIDTIRFLSSDDKNIFFSVSFHGQKDRCVISIPSGLIDVLALHAHREHVLYGFDPTRLSQGGSREKVSFVNSSP